MNYRLEQQSPGAPDFGAIARALEGCGDGQDIGGAGLKQQVQELIDLVRESMFPDVFGGPALLSRERSLAETFYLLRDILEQLPRPCPPAEETARRFLEQLPEVKALLETDVRAAYEGDPAARNEKEVMLAYPAFEAISIFRAAHCLYVLGVPVLPRMMTEYAHRITGIDIHPGATIGGHFFIDHGTGVVIGETTTIGEHVKLYQGVTLGAKSFEVAPDGTLVKGIKRHPDLGDHVVVYAGATILGGSTVIGDGCVIGGNVWLTHSVPPGETVLAARSSGENSRES